MQHTHFNVDVRERSWFWLINVNKVLLIKQTLRYGRFIKKLYLLTLIKKVSGLHWLSV